MKRALVQRGVVSSGAVAPGTPELAPDEAEAFDAAFREIRELAQDLVGAPWLSEWPDFDGGTG